MSNSNRSGLSTPTVLILLVVALAVGAGAGIFGWIWISGGSGEASLSAQDALATRTAEDAKLAAAVGTAVGDAINNALPDAVNVAVANAVDLAVGAAMDTMITEVVDTVAAAQETIEPVTFSIVAAESRATFTLEEDLRGARTTVVGATNDVAGVINVNLADPAASSIGTIIINARTLETDNNFRNRAIRSQILKSAQDAYEFIVFEPRVLKNFSADSIAVGETITFDVSGDLTVVDVTRTVTFAAEVTLDSETQLSGTATVNVLHGDFALTIPDVPSVANVTDDVDLTLRFVARASS
ncbi:MAG: YceI family protein [Chloroflexi bacterium]|nr:YceI family protein [Chloroflexota bacterium]